MKVIDAERAIKEALAEGGAKFSALGLSTDGYVLFSDAKYMQCEPEQSKYMTAVLAIKTPDDNTAEAIISDEDDEEEENSEIESNEASAEADGAEDVEESDELSYEDEDEVSDSHVYEIDFGFDVKNGEIADGDVKSAILTFFEDCDEVAARLKESEDLGAALDELRLAEETEYLALLKKLKTIRLGFLVAIGVVALIVILAIIL